MVKVACVQLNSGNDVRRNIKISTDLIRKAAAKGAKFIATPEYTGGYGTNKYVLENAEKGHDLELLAELKYLAAELKVEILIGSIIVKDKNARKLDNRSILISNEGQVIAEYNKIMLCDVMSRDIRFEERKHFRPGKHAVAARTSSFGRHLLGMTICYDIRFPKLFRKLSATGAGVITVAAAFTYDAGKNGDWEILLRANAINSGTFIIAPAQCGNQGGWKTYGNSMIIDPHGKILARAEDNKPCFILADIDLKIVTAVRKFIPYKGQDVEFNVKVMQ